MALLLKSGLNINQTLQKIIKQNLSNIRTTLNTRKPYSTQTVKPLDVSANVAKDTLIYEYSNPIFFRNMTIFGVAQFMFWTYLTGFTFTNLRNVTVAEESRMLGVDEESLPWWRKMNLGANLYRNGLAGLCAIFGVSVLGISLLYPSRAVRSLHLLKGGRQVRVQTYSLLHSSRDFHTNLDTISCLHARVEKKPQIAMKIQGRSMFFMLDKRGRFHEQDIFDYVIGLRRQF